MFLARPLRVELMGAVYHVIARGNERKAIFRDDLDREVYLKRLAQCRSRFQFRVLGYCLMNNHVHLALERGPVALSRTMLALQSFYVQRLARLVDRPEAYRWSSDRFYREGKGLPWLDVDVALEKLAQKREEAVWGLGSIVYSCIPSL